MLDTIRSPLAKKVAVSALAPLLSLYTDELEVQYMAVLESLSERDFSHLLSLPPREQQPPDMPTGANAAMMDLESPIAHLDPTRVVELLAAKITATPPGAPPGGGGASGAVEGAGDGDGGLENLEPEHVDILLRVVRDATAGRRGAAGPGDGGIAAAYDEDAARAPAFDRREVAEKWLEVFKKIELHLYVALADDELCDRIVVVLNQWIRALGDKAFDTFPTLTKSLKLIFGHPPSPQACQVAAIRLVMSLTSHSEAMDRKLAETVQNAETAEAMLDITRHVAANDAASLDVDAAKAWLTPLQSKPQ